MVFEVTLIEKAKNAKSPDELLTLAKEYNIDLTAEQAKEYYTALNSEGELADNELDNVAGGGICTPSNKRPARVSITSDRKSCPKCHAKLTFVEPYVGGKDDYDMYKCPLCKLYYRNYKSDDAWTKGC